MRTVAERRVLLRRARLYLVTDLSPAGRALGDVLEPALVGGVDVVQLRDKHASTGELRAAAQIARELCDRAGALLIVNDDPALARATGADGAHVGQDDMSVAAARELAGDELLVGISTHDPRQIDAAIAARADYLGVGPVYATPTKPGRPSVGLELVALAAGAGAPPWFAIGGIDERTIGAVVDAGAGRVAVVRAITEAGDPRAAAGALCAVLERRPLQELRGAA